MVKNVDSKRSVAVIERCCLTIELWAERDRLANVAVIRPSDVSLMG